MQDQFYQPVAGASTQLVMPDSRTLTDAGNGLYIFNGGQYPDQNICWTVQSSKTGYGTGSTSAMTQK